MMNSILFIFLLISSFHLVFCLWPYSFENSSIQLIVPYAPGGSTYSLALILNSTFFQIFGVELNLTVIQGNGGYVAWSNIPTSKKTQNKKLL